MLRIENESGSTSKFGYATKVNHVPIDLTI